jgi:hypothetical protein
MDVYTVVAEFAVQVVEAIHTVVILLKAIPVVTILTEICVHQQIAVLTRASEVNVVTILIITLNVQCHRGNAVLQFSNLLKEGA